MSTVPLDIERACKRDLESAFCQNASILDYCQAGAVKLRFECRFPEATWTPAYRQTVKDYRCATLFPWYCCLLPVACCTSIVCISTVLLLDRKDQLTDTG